MSIASAPTGNPLKGSQHCPARSNRSLARLGTRRMRLIQRAGRLASPKGRLTLTLSANPAVQAAPLHRLNVAA
ncbi:MAG: hypothetical protein ACYCT1_06280 [Steroidobacteraceae bacterium]